MHPVIRFLSVAALCAGISLSGSASRPLASDTDSVSASGGRAISVVPQRHVYVKTNVPAWFMLWTNAAAEIDVAPHWSANLSVYYSGFNYFTSDTKFRTFTVMPEMRYWPGASDTGFFIGAHFGMAFYNVAFGGDRRYQDHGRSTPALGGGISCGFRIAFPRNPRWKMEFSIGAGVYRLDYDIFENRHNGLLLDRRKRTFFGLDNAAVSLCYTFDLNKKGGAR